MNDTVSLSGGGDYQTALARLLRQQQFADQSQREAMEPLQAPQGAVAPISWTNVLAKAMQAWGARRQSDKIDERVQQLGQQDRSRADALAAQLTKQTPAIPGPQTTVSGTLPSLPGQSAPQPQGPQVPMQAPTAAPQAALSPDQQMAAILAAHGGPETQAIKGAMLPQLMQRQSREWEQQQPMGVADQQRMDAQLKNQEAAARYTNQLPQTANERATNALGWAAVNKPQFVPFGSPGYMSGGKFNPMNTMPGGSTEVDPTSNSLNAQTGLSQLAIDRATGAPNQPRTASIVAKVDQELTDYSKKNNVNLATMRARAEGVNKVVTQNTIRNNQGTVLENEIAGSVQTLAPLLDQMGAGHVNAANVAAIWTGRQVNDPTAQQAADQLGRLRDELAGYNAVAGGHLLENGTPSPSPADFEAASHTILNGISSGGARAVAESVGKSAAKNKVVLANALDDANQQLWDIFGKGKNYKRTAPPLNSINPGAAGAQQSAPPGWTLHQDAKGNKAYVSPDGKQFMEVK